MYNTFIQKLELITIYIYIKTKFFFKNKFCKKKHKKVKVKQRNPYAVGVALRTGSGFHSNKKYNRTIEKRKFDKQNDY